MKKAVPTKEANLAGILMAKSSLREKPIGGRNSQY